MRASTAPEVSAAGAGAAAAGYLSSVHARWLTDEPDRRWRELDATLVFADVSGFTKLGERLARQGKIGSEELTDVVNRVFVELLAPVRNLGGDMLKFGGDAMLVLFEGEGHPQRAAAAAQHMQGAIRSLRRLRTSAGGLSLRLSIGVATGRLHLFLAGSAFRELIVAGPLASEVVQLESAALPGEVLVGAATAAALAPQHLSERRGPGALLHSAPPISWVEPSAPPAGAELANGLPDHLRARESSDGEHRTVTIGFLQYRGLDELLREAGTDATADTLDDLIGALQGSCRARGVTFVGTDVDNDAGKVILLAGAPVASPDDEDGMLHVLGAVVGREWPWPLEVRAGVNRGRAFVVDVGPLERRTYTVMGDATNLAARVMGKAPAGAVLATRAVLDHARDDFARTPVEPFMVKGKSRPVHAEVVGEARGGRRAGPASSAPIVGREREVAVLHAALEEVRAGGQRIVELVGEPGIGKSRLVEAAVEAAPDFVLSVIAAGPYGAFSPYLVVRAPLRELIGCAPEDEATVVAATLERRTRELDPELLQWLPLIGIPFGVELEPTPETAALGAEFSRAKLQTAIGRLVDRILGPRPTLLVIEDAHWLDDSSSELLATLMRGRGSGGRAVLLTRRDTPTGLSLAAHDDVVTMMVEPLTAWDARELLREAGFALSAHDQAELVERAAGNPLFLQELLAAARAGETVEGLPDSVEALITARIDLLPHADRDFLRQASILGVRVPTDLLEDMLGCGPHVAQATLRRLDDFLVPEAPGRVRFRHALLREAAYGALPFRRRRALHARAAQMIEAASGQRAKEEAELLALHFHEAGMWQKSWRHARVAGEHALGNGAPVEAARFLKFALEAARHIASIEGPKRSRVAEQLGDAEMLAGRHDQAAAAYGMARRAVRGDPLAEADLCRKEGLLRERHKHYAQALRWYSRALSLIEFEDSRGVERLRAQLYCVYGSCRLRQGKLRDCLPLLERAADGARRAGDRATLAHVYYLLDWAHTDLGTPDAQRYRDLALPIYEELGDYAGQAKCLNNLGIDANYEGRWDEAVSLYERSLEMTARWGDVVQVGVLQNNIAEIRVNQGRLDEAEALVNEALNAWRAASFTVGIGAALTHLGAIATRRGERYLAAARLAEARETLESIGAAAMVLELDVREGERLIFAREPQAALALVGTSRDAVQRQGGAPLLLPAFQRIAAFAKLQLGDFDGARVRLLEALDLAQPVGAVFEEALAHEALARMRGGDAFEHAERAAEMLARLGVVGTALVPMT